ncbi:T9SS type A sorting domain-containing protein [Nonlabens sp. Asnod3-H03]|uniref:DUF7619 domain-containing protein n=1 Tax=Nonlabens sp. Asnod3-H03 TaxID=3160580 RepID=UPI003868E66F
MRKLIFLIALSCSFYVVGQNINIPDVRFKNYLISADNLVDSDNDGLTDTDADLNNDGEIDQNEAQQVVYIDLGNTTSSNGAGATHTVSNLEGLQFFSNLEVLYLKDVIATVVPILNSTSLRTLHIKNNSITTIDLSNLTSLASLNLYNTNISSLDLSMNVNLEYLYIGNVPLTSLTGLSGQPLHSLYIEETELTTLQLDNIDDSLFNDQYSYNSHNINDNPFLTSIVITNSVLSHVTVSYNDALNLIDTSNSNIYYLKSFFNNTLNTINITNSSLYGFAAGNNPVLSTINHSNSEFRQIILSYNNIYFLDFENVVNLEDVRIFSNTLRELNLNNNSSLNDIEIVGNFQRLFLQNTEFSHFNLSLSNNNLSRYICVSNDIFNLYLINTEITQQGITNIVVNDYCSFGAGGVTSEINGTLIFDDNNDGCDVMDPSFTNLVLNATDGNVSGFISTNSDGDYIIPVTDGQHTITPNPENPSYWNFSPSNVVVDFPTITSPFTQDFCVTANGTVEDLEVIVVPLEQARPGFDTDYKVIVKNKGNQTASGSVTLDFEEDFMTLGSTNPTASQPATNQLSWSFSNLQPFQMEEYEFTMTINTPTQATNPLNGGDILTFTGTVTGTGTDIMPADNVMVFDQTVVNSYDPNDKTCLEGETIDPAYVGEYVHYMIRFENTGTASAVNIVVKDEIDLTQFDISTLIPLGGSHDYYTRIREGNIVEFIHENINLDFNDATNDGYVLFKIKTLSSLTAGDTFDNTAEIFFDFNFPIITNTETVTVMSTASVGESTDSSIKVYPNPAKSFINLSASNSLESVTIMDINGRTLSQTNFTGNSTDQRVSIENLSSGIYFVTIQSDLGQKVEKLVVE